MVVSKNGVALVVMVISLLGGDVSESDLITTLSVIGQVVSIALMAWNQYARPNVKKFIFKE
jgi:hypothetical protein